MMLFVINQYAGNGKGLLTWHLVESRLKQLGTKYIACVTATPEEAEKHVRAHLTQYPHSTIAVLGGDGTIHRLLPILLETQAALGVIPAGSGNDTARGFHIPIEPLQALNTILHGQRTAVDLIQANNKWTLTALATGFDAEVAEAVNESRYKRWCNRLGIGSAAYVIGALITMFKFKPSRATITINGTIHQYDNVWLTAIANSTSYGGGIRICPQADPGDGEVDVCIVHGCSRWTLMRLFSTVFSGNHVNLPYVSMLRGYDVHITSSINRVAYGDGERTGTTPLRATIRRHKLFLIQSTTSYHHESKIV
ncbi:putative lipid kinase [Paenibacillus alvei DSM 29]|nr:putative lipid kinase [Paenibacillus alvei DSM 29]